MCAFFFVSLLVFQCLQFSLRLGKKLEAVLNLLDKHYVVFAKLLTDYRMDSPADKSDQFQVLLGPAWTSACSNICVCVHAVI